jgi:GTP diphosphokinase / guanosine-3',5'-bis(diphosphate) 3'-diphosphatase
MTLEATRPSLQATIDLVRKAHEGQVDKAGQPYVEHPLRMMQSLDGEDEKIVALLHDVVEDTPITLDMLRSAGYGEHIVEAVDCLTKREGETYETFISRAAANSLARQVKIADLKDNMNPSRISNLTEKDRQRMEKYRRALQQLEAEMDAGKGRFRP